MNEKRKTSKRKAQNETTKQNTFSKKMDRKRLQEMFTCLAFSIEWATSCQCVSMQNGKIIEIQSENNMQIYPSTIYEYSRMTHRLLLLLLLLH